MSGCCVSTTVFHERKKFRFWSAVLHLRASLICARFHSFNSYDQIHDQQQVEACEFNIHFRATNRRHRLGCVSGGITLPGRRSCFDVGYDALRVVRSFCFRTNQIICANLGRMNCWPGAKKTTHGGSPSVCSRVSHPGYRFSSL